MNDAVKLLAPPMAPRAALAAARAVRAVPEPSGAAAALIERLRAARQAARAGQLETARWICAGAILRHQPLLAGSVPLLRQTIVTLLDCRAFGQLARLLGALRGGTVRFCTGLAQADALAPPEPTPTGAAADYVLDPAWFARPDADRIVRHWAEVLAAGRPVAPPVAPLGDPAEAHESPVSPARG